MSEQQLHGHFVAIPEKTLLSKKWKALSPTTRCVYITMLLRYKRKGTQATGMITWSQVDLADQAGLSLKTVNTHTAILVLQKWVDIWEPGGRWAKGTTYKVNSLYANGIETPEPTE